MPPLSLGIGLGVCHGGSNFTPASVANAVEWHEADSVVDVGSGVISQFNEKLGRGGSVLSAAVGQRGNLVANALNGRPGVSVTGGQRYSTAARTITTFTELLVVKSSTANTIIQESGIGYPNPMRWIYTGGLASLLNGTPQHFLTRTKGTWGDNTFRVLVQHFTGSVHQLRTNGVPEANTPTGTIPSSISGLGSQIQWYGARFDGTFGSTMTLCRRVFCQPHISDSDLALLEQSSAALYGIKMNPTSVEIYTAGDSNTGATAGASGVDAFLFSQVEDPGIFRVYNAGVAGNTISQQQTAFEAYANRTTVPIVTCMCGTNDIATLSAQPTATAVADIIIGRLQTFWTSVKSINPNCYRAQYTILRTKQRWVNLFGATIGAMLDDATAQINTRIMAGEIGAALVHSTRNLTSAVCTSTDIDATYLLGDGTFVHWNNTARQNVYAVDLRIVIIGARGTL